MRGLRALVLVTFVALHLPVFGEATLELSIDTDKVHAGLPFTLTATVRGFDEEPVPDPPELEIAGSTVTYVGVSPNVRTQLTIINGRRSESREVSFSYRWRVTAAEAKEYLVPALSVSQNDVVASSRAASFVAGEIETTDDMVVRLDLPSRTVWAGESFDVTIEWLLLREVQNFEFSVPLFDVEGVRVLARDAPGSRRYVPFDVGTEQTELPLVSDKHRENAKDYTRVQFPARVVLSSPGTFELDPVRVAAELVFPGRDRFGFSNRRTQLYTARAQPHRLVVAPLPTASRPASFVNAIGTGFAFDVAASKTVVAAGEPIELTLTLRGTGLLEGLSLPALDGSDGLDPDQFGLLDLPNVGIDRDGAREFQAVVRVISPDVSEIPPLPFSFFDPEAAEYRTVYSAPIALSVRQGSVVDAADVATAVPRAELSPAVSSSPPRGNFSLNGANMALGPMTTSGSGGVVELYRYALAPLYVVPLLFLAFVAYRRRTEADRGHKAVVRQAERVLDEALGATEAARRSAPAIVNAVRELARVMGRRDERMSELEEIEQAAFNPVLADKPVDDELKARLRERIGTWTVLVIVLLITPSLADRSIANAASNDQVAAVSESMARSVYAEALETSDRTDRLRRFARAESAYRELVAERSDEDDLLADWGNAALGAETLGVAILAFRRALDENPANARARTNLAWVRDRLPVWLPRPQAATMDALLFWRLWLADGLQLLLGAIAFAAAVLSLVPRVLGRGGSTVGTGVLIALWLMFVVPVLMDTADDGVVLTDGVTLRAADSVGAPASFANPLPAGTEVAILEQRGAWARVSLSDGSVGWLTDGAIEKVRLD